VAKKSVYALRQNTLGGVVRIEGLAKCITLILRSGGLKPATVLIQTVVTFRSCCTETKTPKVFRIGQYSESYATVAASAVTEYLIY
jgi:hypothetical protein